MLRQGTVYLVGAGPGDPGLITRRGLDALRTADVVVHDRLVSAELLLEARPDARLVSMGKSPCHDSPSQDEINRALASEAKAGRTVCRLKGGDPFLFGRGAEEADHLAKRGIPFVIVPGVSSALAAPAYAGIPLTDRRLASTVAISTGHEASGKDRKPVHWAALAEAADTLVVLMGMANLREVTRRLVDAGRRETTPAAVVHWGTIGRQQVAQADLATIADEVDRQGLAPPAVLIVGDVVSLRSRLAWFEDRPLRGVRVLVSRPRGQAPSLAQLLRDAGAEPVICPLLRVELLSLEPEQLAAVVDGRWDWVIFTSANGVDCFGQQLVRSGFDWRRLADARLAATGAGTARALQARELGVDFVPSRSLSDCLAEELPGVSGGTRVLAPQAAEAREDLPRILRARGAEVETLAIYRVEPESAGVEQLRSALREEAVDVLAFTSPAAVRAATLASGISALNQCRVACIGPITAAAARDLGLKVAIEAETHTMPGLVAAIEEHFAARDEAEAAGQKE